MSSDPSRPIIARLRRRMLLALGRGTAPLSRAAAYALLPDLAERFAANDDLADAQGAAFFAALSDDPDLAESFALLVEATATTGALAPSPGLAARLAAIPQRPAVSAHTPWSYGTFDQPLAVSRIINAWLGQDLSLPVPRRSVLPPPGALTPRFLREDATPAYDLRDPQDREPPIIRLTDPAGAHPPTDLALTTHRDTNTVALILHLREPGTVNPSPHAWRVTARLDQRTIAGTFTAPGTWQPTRPLSPDEFARLTLTIEPAA